MITDFLSTAVRLPVRNHASTSRWSLPCQLRNAFVALTAFLLASGALRAQVSRTPLAQGTVAIVSVNVIPMTRDTVLRDMTVLVVNGRISRLGTARSVAIPNGARRIDGRGKFLIPGLADVHTHLYSDEDVPDSLASLELGVMLAHGITAARLMIGTPEQLTLRRDVIEGRVVGPQLWLASPQLTGARSTNAIVVTTPEAARAAVRQSAADGFDFIKLTEAISPEVYDAIADQARVSNIRVDGHVDPRVGVRRALAAGQGIQHLDSYIEEVLADSAPSRVSLTQGGVGRLQNWKTIDHVDEKKIAAIAGATARAGVWITPTLTIFNKAFGIGFTDEEMRNRPDWNIMPSAFRQLYVRARERYWNPANDSVRTPARRARYVGTRNAIAKAIADSGGRILAGSDAPDLLMAYGWTLHRELESLVTAGLTPYQALASATRNPAEYFGALAEWGTIQNGRRADLVLLSANPLDDIRNTSKIEAVVIGGRLLEQKSIQNMIQTAMSRINGN